MSKGRISPCFRALRAHNWARLVRLLHCIVHQQRVISVHI